MRVAVFSAKGYDREFLAAANVAGGHGHELVFVDARLTRETAALAAGFPGICTFVNDVIDEEAAGTLAEGGTRLIALRCAGFNQVDLAATTRAGMTVSRVPGYSPYAVAEHAVALMLALNRRLHRAYARVREGNFALDGLIGFDLHGRTVGVVGTGQIGEVFARIVAGFGCRVIASDPVEREEVRTLGVEYVALDRLFAESDVIALHCPLTAQTHHLIDERALGLMRDGVMLINTGRGGLIDTRAVLEALKRGRIGYLGLDVYEEEAGLFFEDRSSSVIQDDVFARLLTFPNVLITGHQGFFTREALANIAATTMENIAAFERGEPSGNEVSA